MIRKRTASADAQSPKAAGSDSVSRLQSVNQYLEKNFPDFFAEARFQVGDDDYFLYARFGQYLARSIEQSHNASIALPRALSTAQAVQSCRVRIARRRKRGPVSPAQRAATVRVQRSIMLSR